MKHMIKKGLFASALVLLSSTGFAGPKNVIINANVVGVCEFSTSGDATINFGNLQSGGADAEAGTTVGFWCSKDTAYTLTTSDGKNADSVGGQKNLVLDGNKIPYALALDKANGTGFGKGRPIDVTLTATIANSALDEVPAGTGYTDTVVLTLTP